jgi:hypothetical protein
VLDWPADKTMYWYHALADLLTEEREALEGSIVVPSED